jgi:predicted transcriptional regulator
MGAQQHDRGMSILRRAPILDACRDGPVSRRELEETTDNSRTTVYRATVDLEEQGLLEQRDGGYLTTPRGEAVSRIAEEYRHGIDAIDRLEPLLDRITHPELLSNAHLLSDAGITVADEDHIYRANDRVLDLWADSDRVRMCAVAPGSRICLQGAMETTVEHGIDVEMCFLPDAMPSPEQLESDVFDPSDAFEYFETYTSDRIPFTFVLFDDVAAIAAHNEVSIPVVLAESDDPRVYEWLDGLYAEIEASARPVRELAV